VEHDIGTKIFLILSVLDSFSGLNGLAENAAARETALSLNTEKLLVTFAAQIARKKI
jgi:hypothetical protein